jgi:hypothetical protein
VRDEAREVFERTEAPRDFDTIEIPFPEKGPAQLVRWSSRPRKDPQDPATNAEPVAAR